MRVFQGYRNKYPLQAGQTSICLPQAPNPNPNLAIGITTFSPGSIGAPITLSVEKNSLSREAVSINIGLLDMVYTSLVIVVALYEHNRNSKKLSGVILINLSDWALPEVPTMNPMLSRHLKKNQFWLDRDTGSLTTSASILDPVTASATSTGPIMKPTMPINGTPAKMPIIIMTGGIATRFPIITGR